jgi:methyltransferase family protein
MAFWTEFLRLVEARSGAEVGVFRGVFAAHLLANCPSLSTYYMIDPWRHLEEWNKPANRDDAAFARIFADAMRRTAAYEERRNVLRGRTVDVIHEIGDEELDFTYIDGDHTLRGIMVDLICMYPKVRAGGWIGGDDFSPSIWQHGHQYEPTLVFPAAVHFAEAVGARIYGLPHKQFLIEKRVGRGHEFVDLTGEYADLSILSQAAGRSAPPPRRPVWARLRALRSG